MQVLLIVRMLVMVPVMGGPPKRASLGRAGAKNAKKKLRNTAGLKRFMGKVSVVEASNGEHAHGEKADCKDDGKGTGASDDDQQTGQMKCYKGNHPEKIESPRACVEVIRTRSGVEPSQNVCQPVLHSGHTLIALSFVV